MILYQIKLCLMLLIALLLYWVIFRTDSRFKFNRFYLLFSLIFALLLPFSANWTEYFAQVPYDDVHEFSNSGAEWVQPILKANEQINNTELLEKTMPSPFWVLWIVGSLFMAIRFSFNLNKGKAA